LALSLLVLGLALTACGSSSSAPPPAAATNTPAAVATTTPTGAPPSTIPPSAGTFSCPTAAIVGAALGITLSAPTAIPGGGGQTLPAGATGVACDYKGTASNVLIQLITNIDPTYITKFSDRFPVPFTSVSGVGDQARSFRQPLNGGKDNEGVVATKGSTIVAVTATATPASLAQVEALVEQLL
jgi:hypothetical protein